MVCHECSNWKREALTYDELCEKWSNAIGGDVTPGHLNRYRKESERKGIAMKDVRIGYKYCSSGMLSRFYLRKGESDTKAIKPMKGCSDFTTGAVVDTSGGIWQVCTVETHGPSEAKGIPFTPGLYENHTYMRIPSYGSVRPTIERGVTECSVCGERTKRSIKVEKTFCCNKHYLEWWGKRFREELKRLSS